MPPSAAAAPTCVAPSLSLAIMHLSAANPILKTEEQFWPTMVGFLNALENPIRDSDYVLLRDTVRRVVGVARHNHSVFLRHDVSPSRAW